MARVWSGSDKVRGLHKVGLPKNKTLISVKVLSCKLVAKYWHGYGGNREGGKLTDVL